MSPEQEVELGLSMEWHGFAGPTNPCGLGLPDLVSVMSQDRSKRTCPICFPIAGPRPGDLRE